MRKFRRGALKLEAVVLSAICTCPATRATNRSDSKQNLAQQKSYIGDAPAAALPLATDLSPALNTKAIDKAVRKVGDWELRRSEKHFRQDWTYAVLYAGFMAAANALPDRKYQTAMLHMGNRFDWQLNPVAPGKKDLADNHAIGQTYLALYGIYVRPKMIGPTEAKFDRQMRVPDDPAHPVWWWADAIFMGPPTWVRLYRATGNKAYLDYMDREFWITSTLLYQPKERLYSRDASYLNKRSRNGQRLFWSRGNGWVLAGIARVLQDMPANYPSRPKYVERFRQMAAEVASLQGADGLWRADLLDPDAYPAPEVSGSALFIYAMAWGIDHGILDRASYLPVVQKGWRGLLTHVYQDGRLGSIQPIGSEPVTFPPTSSYVYGVGGFLLAGAELHRLAERR
jgi:unsaturated rhamnogalacturonyl hydrolase